MRNEQIARVCHEANRGYRAAVPTPGIPVAPSWDEFPADQQAGVIAGVAHALDGATPQQLHESWAAEKLANGWKYGPVKDAEARTHPCLVPYASLPAEQRVKDALFQAIVRALATPGTVQVLSGDQEFGSFIPRQMPDLLRESKSAPTEVEQNNVEGVMWAPTVFGSVRNPGARVDRIGGVGELARAPEPGVADERIGFSNPSSANHLREMLTNRVAGEYWGRDECPACGAVVRPSAQPRHLAWHLRIGR